MNHSLLAKIFQRPRIKFSQRLAFFFYCFSVCSIELSRAVPSDTLFQLFFSIPSILKDMRHVSSICKKPSTLKIQNKKLQKTSFNFLQNHFYFGFFFQCFLMKEGFPNIFFCFFINYANLASLFCKIICISVSFPNVFLNLLKEGFLR